VFFIQDAIKFPDFVHAVKPEPHNEIPQASSAIGEAYKHAKAIATSGDSAEIFTQLGIETADDPESGVVTGDAAEIADSFIEEIGKHRAWNRTGRLSVPA
jgi:hypothetical protein